MTKHEDITLDAGGGDLRAMFVADPGFVFLEPDLAQAEDRAVCVLAKDWQALKDYERTNFKRNPHGLKDDRHTNTAMYVTGLGFEAITDWERQVGKKTRHSGNYAVGKHQHMLTLSKSGIFISEFAAGKQLTKFHDSNPNIKGVFHLDIQQALQECNCILKTPFGRERQFFNRWSEELFKEAYAFIPQSTISDQVKFAMIRIISRLGKLYMKDFFFVEESHDSFLALCRNDLVSEAAKIIKEEMEQPINFRMCTLNRDYDLVIPSDIKVGNRWIDRSEVYPDGMHKIEGV
jgi:DNA polymerase I-like protein with 3'-5' exonuclease and polymerase domains